MVDLNKVEFDGDLLVGAVLLFLLINFSTTVGGIYSTMVLISILAYVLALLFKVFTIIPTESKTNNRLEALLWSVGAYAAFIMTASFLAKINFQSILQIVSSPFATSPIFARSVFLSILTWGVLIPVIETKAFFRTGLQWIAKWLHIKTDTPFSFDGIKLMVLVSAIFTIFHASAKGPGDNTALLVTFIFGIVSVFLVLYFQEVKQAIMIHIVSNTLATLSILGIGGFSLVGITSAAYFPWIIIGMIIFFIFQKQIKQAVRG